MTDATARILLPRRTHFGIGTSQEIVEVVSSFEAKSVFVVTDEGVSKAGLVAPLVGRLEQSSIRVAVFDRAAPEPTVECIEEASDALADARKTDLILSVGGGSVMDTAKCANIVHGNGGSILDYEDGIEGERRAVKTLLPHVCVPTTAGTGSEATVWAVFIDPKRRFKTAVQDPRLLADVAILDPDMTRTMPPRVAASTGMDALTHAIEAYVSLSANPVTEAFCLEAMRLISRNLVEAVKNPVNASARTSMLLASFLAGSAFSNSTVGIVHTLAEALGGFYRMPHGVANALLLPHVMEFNRSANPAKFATIAATMGQEVGGLPEAQASGRSVDAVTGLMGRIGLPRELREVGVRREDFPELVTMAFKWANVSGNPRTVSEDELMSLYEEAY